MSSEMLHDLWCLGSIVRLKEAYKPDTESFLPFTHGIIVQHLGQQSGHIRVSLFLYNPTDPRLYIEEEHNGIPTYCDFRSDELLLVKHGRSKGYSTEDE